MRRPCGIAASVCGIVALFFSTASLSRAQWEIPTPAGTAEPAPASIRGTVVAQRNGIPLNRASVVLTPRSAGLPPLSVTTDVKGRYSFSGVPPGVYEIQVSRDGFLPSSTGWMQSYRFPPVFTLRPGADLDALEFRLFPWGVVSGQVTFEDASPAVNAEVALYRDVWRRGSHIYEIAARGRTDDRGNYRLYNISPGTYFLSAGWSRPASVPGAIEQARRDQQGKVVPDQAYAVTFYPSVQKLLDAAPIRLGYGDEATAIDVVLNQTPTVRILGHVTSALTGQWITNPGITLRRVGADDALSVGAAVALSLDQRGGFELSGVAPGAYDLVAEADEDGKHLIGRRLVPVGEESITNLDVLAVPPKKWTGRIRLVNGDPVAEDILSRIRIEAEPRDDLAPSASASPEPDGAFELELAPGETYDIYVRNLPEDAYLASAAAAGVNLISSGADLNPGATPEPMQLGLSLSGAGATGVVLNDDRTVAPGVNIDLVPDPPAGRYQAFQQSYADEYGNFHLTGIPPGKYIMIAWAGEAPCDIYDPGSLPACRAAGAEVTFREGERETVTLRLAHP